MYVRTLERLGLGLGQLSPPPQLPLRILTFSSSVIVYKDKDGDDQCRLTNCSIYVPSALRNQPKIDLLVFFHGHDTCPTKHDFIPSRVVNNFQLDDQVDKAKRKVALVVPSVFWRYDGHPNGSDLKNIRVAWSAANLNAFVEEVLDKIGNYGVRPKLGHLILAGHSRAYDILTPLADQFDCGVPETKKGALAKLDKVLAMDTTYGWGFEHAKALEKWARQFEANPKPVQFILVLSNGGTPPKVWKKWREKMDKAKVKLPTNLKVHTMTKDDHCAIVGKINSFL